MTGRPHDATGSSVERAMNIRAYRQSDWPHVCAIYDASKPSELAGIVEPGRILPLAADDGMRKLFAESRVIVAEVDAKPAGFAGNRGSFVTWLFVHPALRRRGVATALLGELVAGLERPVALNVAAANGAARLLYERLGFQVEREFVGDFQGTPCAVVRLSFGPGPLRRASQV